MEVLEAFRSSFPENKLQLEASKQIAYAYRQSGQLSRAAGEYDSIASKSTDPALRSEALLDRRRTLRAIQFPGPCVGFVHPLCERVSEAG